MSFPQQQTVKMQEVLVEIQQQIVGRLGGPAEPGLWRLSRLWQFPAAPADSAALPSIRVCDSRTISWALQYLPREPPLRAHSLAVPAHTYVNPLPSWQRWGSSSRHTRALSAQHHASIQRLQTDVDAQPAPTNCLVVSVGPVYLTCLINKDRLRRPSCASPLSH